jgi:GTP pyrophosphokinase
LWYSVFERSGGLTLEDGATVRIEDIEEDVQKYHPDADLNLLRRGYVFAAKVHQGQERRSGEPYLTHPLEVARILTQLKMDESTLAAGLLHDSVEDKLTNIDEVRKVFGVRCQSGGGSQDQ